MCVAREKLDIRGMLDHEYSEMSGFIAAKEDCTWSRIPSDMIVPRRRSVNCFSSGSNCVYDTWTVQCFNSSVHVVYTVVANLRLASK